MTQSHEGPVSGVVGEESHRRASEEGHHHRSKLLFMVVCKIYCIRRCLELESKALLISMITMMEIQNSLPKERMLSSSREV